MSETARMSRNGEGELFLNYLASYLSLLPILMLLGDECDKIHKICLVVAVKGLLEHVN